MKTIGLTFVDAEKTVDTEKKPVEKKKKSAKKAEIVDDVILPDEDK